MPLSGLLVVIMVPALIRTEASVFFMVYIASFELSLHLRILA